MISVGHRETTWFRTLVYLYKMKEVCDVKRSVCVGGGRITQKVVDSFRLNVLGEEDKMTNSFDSPINQGFSHDSE